MASRIPAKTCPMRCSFPRRSTKERRRRWFSRCTASAATMAPSCAPRPWMRRKRAGTSSWVRWAIAPAAHLACHLADAASGPGTRPRPQPEARRRGAAGGRGGRGAPIGGTAVTDSAKVAELSEKDAMNVLEMMRKEFNVDDRRIYLMGHSLGGGGSLHMGEKYADKWAAVSPTGAGRVRLPMECGVETQERPAADHAGRSRHNGSAGQFAGSGRSTQGAEFPVRDQNNAGTGSRHDHRGRHAGCI